jgi:hypothetical protein
MRQCVALVLNYHFNVRSQDLVDGENAIGESDKRKRVAIARDRRLCVAEVVRVSMHFDAALVEVC